MGEFELIAALRERAAAAGAPAASERLVVASGDDAAVVVSPDSSVVSVDALIEGVHFDLRYTPLRSVGHKALAAALSDLAAMGAHPGEAYLQLGLPETIDEAESLELADGFAALAAQHRVAIAGGDLSRAPSLILAVTVVGYVSAPERAVLRTGATPGDAVVVTGELGGAAAGLLALRRPQLVDGVSEEVANRLRRRQLEPEPRISAGRALADAGASAMIDLSDGLGADLTHLARASRVAIGVELASLPVAAGVAEVARAAGVDPLELAASGGEDYELAATVPSERVPAVIEAAREAGESVSVIGEAGEGDGEVKLVDTAGATRPVAGFDQLAPRAPDERS